MNESLSFVYGTLYCDQFVLAVILMWVSYELWWKSCINSVGLNTKSKNRPFAFSVCVCVCACARTCVYIYICVCAHVCVIVCVCMCMLVCVHMHAYFHLATFLHGKSESERKRFFGLVISCNQDHIHIFWETTITPRGYTHTLEI